MLCILRFQGSTPSIQPPSVFNVAGTLTSCRPVIVNLRLPQRGRTIVRSLQSPETAATSERLDSSQFISFVGSPPAASRWNLTQGHITMLNIIACAVAISATWLFCSAIPTLLAFKRAAESLEKLLDVTREELPDTMAAVRLSGMEISDFTMELNNIGQDITQGVRSSTRAVSMAEERLRQFTNLTSSAPTQELSNLKPNGAEPAVARTARSIRERIVKGRAMLQTLFSLTRFSRLVFDYFATRARH